ncbi:hypothetical protein F2P56_008807 [Juglans regia]|uniref:Uncharacterized protein LOC108992525 n=2 Tax=Juglans regia TaxID=51240 RepID=A0A2I4ETF0_JUGRE|nr:uncharacterized protein LOC108992525 [Juglans regia]KAF5472060.1 hypothetical protein F2P56_008807 [Juglans regia]
MPDGRVKTPVKAKVYAITSREVNLEADETADVGVITGKVKLKLHLVCALFDSGASRSFVSVSCAKRCELDAEPLSQRVLVAIPDGKIVAKIDCRGREVVFNLPAKDRICYMEEIVRLDPSVVTAGQVKKSPMSGATIYLVMMTNVIEESKGVQGIPVIEDFPRFFADDLPGLAPD